MKIIKLAEEFSDTPGGRYERMGPDSGELFRKTFLEPALKENDIVLINLNGAYGFGSSFLDEVFGVIVDQLGYDEAIRRMQIQIDDNEVAKLEIEHSMLRHKEKQQGA